MKELTNTKYRNTRSSLDRSMVNLKSGPPNVTSVQLKLFINMKIIETPYNSPYIYAIQIWKLFQQK